MIRTYVDSWKEYDSAKLRSILDSDCVLIESDGEIFRGAEKICRELEKRIAGAYGPWQISRWDITTLVVSDDLCFLEWSFAGLHSFEGASIVRYKNDKIGHVREYCTTKPLWEA